MLSVVLPSRGRPESLLRAVRSLAKGGDGVEIVVGLDEDDESMPWAKELLAEFDNIRVLVGSRPSCQAELFNKLAKAATHEVVCLFSDDYVMDHEDWFERVERAWAALPNGWGISYLHDPMYPFFATFPVMNKATMALNLDGDFLPAFYPFLFGDTHWNEIGVMSGLIVPSTASVSIDNKTGHDHRFADMRLWAKGFHKMRPMRCEIAVKLIRAAFGTHSIAEKLIQTMPERSAMLEELFRKNSMSEEFFRRMETNGWERKYTNPAYPGMKARMEAFLTEIERLETAA